MKILVTINEKDIAAEDLGFGDLANVIYEGLCEEGVEYENIKIEEIIKK